MFEECFVLKIKWKKEKEEEFIASSVCNIEKEEKTIVLYCHISSLKLHAVNQRYP